MDRFTPGSTGTPNPESGTVEEQIPHSGYHGEVPDFPGQARPLEDDAGRLLRELDARTAVPQALVNRTLAENVEAQPIRKKMSLGRKLGLGATSVVAGGLITAAAVFSIGATSSSDEESESAPREGSQTSSQIEEADPDAHSPENTETQESVTSATLDRLDALNYQEFDALPVDERLIWAWNQLDENRSEHTRLLASYYKVEWTDVSIDNDGQQIMDNFIYVLDDVGLQNIPSEIKPNPYDVQAGNKLLSAAYYYVGDGVTTNDYQGVRAANNAREHAAVIDQVNTVTETSELQSGFDIQGNEIRYKVLSFYTQSGESYQARFVFHEFTTATGESQAVWLLEQQVAPGDSFVSSTLPDPTAEQ